jgi:hypothetical protein
MTNASIIFRTSAQAIEQDDLRQLRDAILAAARNELGDILDSVKAGKTPSGAQAQAIARAVDGLHQRARAGFLAGRASLVSKPVAVPRRTTSFAGSTAGPRAQAAAPASTASKLSLRVVKIQCVSDTKEIGKDEILLGAQASMIPVSSDSTFGTPIDAGTTAPIALGKFKSGDTRNLDLVLASFNLRDATPYPRVFNASLLLVEHDFGDPTTFVKLLKGLQALVEDKVTEKVEEFLTGLDGEQKRGALIAIAVAMVPAVLSALVGALGKLFGDEVFAPIAAAVGMESATATFDGKTDTADQQAQFSAFGGTYKVTYDFALS